MESLLRRGADVSARSNDGESALHVVPGGYAELEVPVRWSSVVLVVPFAAFRRKCHSCPIRARKIGKMVRRFIDYVVFRGLLESTLLGEDSHFEDMIFLFWVEITSAEVR